MKARNRGGRGLSYRPARLHRLAELIPWNRFPGPHTRLKIRALAREPSTVYKHCYMRATVQDCTEHFLSSICAEYIKYWSSCRDFKCTLVERLYTGLCRIFKQSMGARNQVGTGLSYRPSKLHRLAELFPLNRFLDSLKVCKLGIWQLLMIFTY
jgi:hypothetical protein